MEDKVKALLNDFGRFAEIASKVKPNKIKYNINELSGKYSRLMLIDIERNGNETVEECFAAAFIISLFIYEEWESNMFETDGISESEWKGYLEKVWLPQYFNGNKVQLYETEKMIDIIKNDIITFGVSKEQLNEMIKDYNTLISVLIEGNYGDLTFFCMNENRIVYYDYIVCD